MTAALIASVALVLSACDHRATVERVYPVQLTGSPPIDYTVATPAP